MTTSSVAPRLAGWKCVLVAAVFVVLGVMAVLGMARSSNSVAAAAPAPVTLPVWQLPAVAPVEPVAPVVAPVLACWTEPKPAVQGGTERICGDESVAPANAVGFGPFRMAVPAQNVSMAIGSTPVAVVTAAPSSRATTRATRTTRAPRARMLRVPSHRVAAPRTHTARAPRVHTVKAPKSPRVVYVLVPAPAPVASVPVAAPVAPVAAPLVPGAP